MRLHLQLQLLHARLVPRFAMSGSAIAKACRQTVGLTSSTATALLFCTSSLLRYAKISDCSNCCCASCLFDIKQIAESVERRCAGWSGWLTQPSTFNAIPRLVIHGKEAQKNLFFQLAMNFLKFLQVTTVQVTKAKGKRSSISHALSLASIAISRSLSLSRTSPRSLSSQIVIPAEPGETFRAFRAWPPTPALPPALLPPVQSGRCQIIAPSLHPPAHPTA